MFKGVLEPRKAVSLIIMNNKDNNTNNDGSMDKNELMRDIANYVNEVLKKLTPEQREKVQEIAKSNIKKVGGGEQAERIADIMVVRSNIEDQEDEEYEEDYE